MALRPARMMSFVGNGGGRGWQRGSRPRLAPVSNSLIGGRIVESSAACASVGPAAVASAAVTSLTMAREMPSLASSQGHAASSAPPPPLGLAPSLAPSQGQAQRLRIGSYNVGACAADAFMSREKAAPFSVKLIDDVRALAKRCDVICFQEVNATWAVTLVETLPHGCGPRAGRRSALIPCLSTDVFARSPASSPRHPPPLRPVVGQRTRRVQSADFLHGGRLPGWGNTIHKASVIVWNPEVCGTPELGTERMFPDQADRKNIYRCWREFQTAPTADPCDRRSAIQHHAPGRFRWHGKSRPGLLEPRPFSRKLFGLNPEGWRGSAVSCSGALRLLGEGRLRRRERAHHRGQIQLGDGAAQHSRP